jgi:hypothetical protein
MAIRAICGKATIEYDKRCSYVCNCIPDHGCDWTVSCPDGKGGVIYTSGTGHIATPPPRPTTVTISGLIEGVAKCLERQWKRQVIVPRKLGEKKIRKRMLQGTPEEIARALGLRLGPKRKI